MSIEFSVLIKNDFEEQKARGFDLSFPEAVSPWIGAVSSFFIELQFLSLSADYMSDRTYQ